MALFRGEWTINSSNIAGHSGWQITVLTSHDPIVEHSYELCYNLNKNEWYFVHNTSMGSITTVSPFEALTWALTNLRRLHNID